jgi:hypothetical protein
MSNNHASASSPVLDSPSKVAGLIFLNSPSRWSICFLFLSGIVLSSAEGVPSDELSLQNSEGVTSMVSSFGIFLVTNCQDFIFLVVSVLSSIFHFLEVSNPFELDLFRRSFMVPSDFF